MGVDEDEKATQRPKVVANLALKSSVDNEQDPDPSLQITYTSIYLFI
jgi:hypothetical protein